MKTAKYRKRCCDQIEGIVVENKVLTPFLDTYPEISKV